MFHRSLLISVVLSVLSFQVLAQAQALKPLRPMDESETAAIRKKAIDLLLTVAGQLGSLRSGENRARIGSNAAEALWEHDEKRARSLFAVVQEDITTGLNDSEPEESIHVHTLMVFWTLRSDTIGRIAKHDPELALDFLRATRLPANGKSSAYFLGDSEEALELRLAGQIAARNPQLALKLGQQALAKGISSEVLSVLAQLQLTDKEATRNFFSAIVDKLRKVKLVEDSEAKEVALTLVRSYRPPEVDEVVYRDLIRILVSTAIAQGCTEPRAEYSADICFEVGSLFSSLKQYDALRSAQLKQWESQEEDDPSSELLPEDREIMEQGTVDERLALAAKYPEMKADIYMAALARAVSSGDFDKARQITSALSDEDQRRYLLAEIDQNQRRRSGKVADVQRELSGMSSNEEKIQFLLELASEIGLNDRKAGLALLDQADQFLDSIKFGKTQLDGKISLALLYCSLKSDRSFAIMEPLMPRLNELVAASVALDGFGYDYLRDGEWNMTATGPVGGLLTSLAQNVGYFAALDFDRSVALAGQLERPELRLMAELKIAQSMINQPKPLPRFQPTVSER